MTFCWDSLFYSVWDIPGLYICSALKYSNWCTMTTVIPTKLQIKSRSVVSNGTTQDTTAITRRYHGIHYLEQQAASGESRFLWHNWIILYLYVASLMHCPIQAFLVTVLYIAYCILPKPCQPCRPWLCATCPSLYRDLTILPSWLMLQEISHSPSMTWGPFRYFDLSLSLRAVTSAITRCPQ